jgi:hypothetical protein
MTRSCSHSALEGVGALASGPTPGIKGFAHGLQQLGYIEGQNLVLIYRFAEGRTARLADLASELLALNVDVIASNSTEAILAIRDLNKTTPVVMTAISDPIGNKLVASFARPGGSITGVTLFSTSWRESGCNCSRKLFHGSPAWRCSCSATIRPPQRSLPRRRRRRNRWAYP